MNDNRVKENGKNCNRSEGRYIISVESQEEKRRRSLCFLVQL